jgi:hypothetical protein
MGSDYRAFALYIAVCGCVASWFALQISEM